VLFSIAGFLVTPPLIKKIAAGLIYEKFQRRLVISGMTLSIKKITKSGWADAGKEVIISAR
jgi:hypothetical protein